MHLPISFRNAGLAITFAAFLFMAAFAPQRDYLRNDERGKLIFDTVCATCHSMTPPALKAPPMLMVAGHYVEARKEDGAAKDAMKEWLKGPDAAKSLLPAHAIERFGLMPPLALPADNIDAVVAYIFAEREKAGSPQPHQEEGEGMQQGQGMQHGRMQGEGMQPGQGMQHGRMQGQGMQHGQMNHGRMQGCQGGQCPMHQQEGQEAPQGQGMQHGQRNHGQMQGAGHSCPMHAQPTDSTKTKGAGMQHRHGRNR